MDVTPEQLILLQTAKAEHDEKMKLNRAQEMAHVAELSRNKSKATYRYSLLAYIREVVQQKAEEGLNNAYFFSRTLPWTKDELQAVVIFCENDGFTVSLEDEMERTYDRNMTGLGFTGELKANGHKILKLTW